MIVQQYYLGCLAHASYLIGDEQTGAAAVVDPQRDVDQYLRDARRLGLRIRHVFLTHFHADFIAGHLELRERVGATIYLGARASAEYEFVPLGDGDTVDLGPEARLEVLETPGHSPESISILVYDLARDPETPYAVLTGDTLFIGDVGRPDLRAALGWSARGSRRSALRLAPREASPSRTERSSIRRTARARSAGRISAWTRSPRSGRSAARTTPCSR